MALTRTEIAKVTQEDTELTQLKTIMKARGSKQIPTNLAAAKHLFDELN
jgi:hypothetical protein